jgi:cyclic pyranopterin phosphate synthase
LREHGVEQVVFNVMQANGRANTHFEQIFPTYTDIAAAFAAFVREQQPREARVMAFLVDIPLCTTTAVPDFNRGYVESYVHFEPAALSHGLLDADAVAARSDEAGLVQIRRADLDDARRLKRDECGTCRYDGVCEGVWSNYLKRHGWAEFVPEVVTEVRTGA